MAMDITVPEVSEGVKAGTVVSVAVAVGDRVEQDQTVLELETDKAVVAIPSPAAGTLTQVAVAEGDQVAVGAVIMQLEPLNRQSGQQPPEPPPAHAQSTAAEPPSTPEPPEQDSPGQHPESQAEPASEAKGTQLDLTTSRRGQLVAPAAPSVRRIARDLGVDIYQVQGSGPGGRIKLEDVRGFVKQTMLQLSGPQAALPTEEFRGLHAQRPLPDFTRWGHISREPLSRVRQVTADAMSYTWSTIPMVTQYDQAEVDHIEQFRSRFNAAADQADKLTMTAILAKICAAALKVFPHFNSSLDSAAKELIIKDYIHIGIAVDTPNGLLVPVLRDVDGKGIATLARELNEMAEKTRQRQLKADDMAGGTFTISNLGGIGGTAFTPLVYAPQVAILGVSRTTTEPVWDGRAFVPRQRLPLCLSYDHRVIDGADGARFLRWICSALENPLQLMMKD